MNVPDASNETVRVTYSCFQFCKTSRVLYTGVQLSLDLSHLRVLFLDTEYFHRVTLLLF